MLKTILQYLLSTIGYAILLLALIFPLASFKVLASSAVFPAIDVIIIYYFVCYHRMGMIKILLISVFIDQLYGLPLGCSTAAFICGSLSLKLASKWFLVKEYVSNMLLFCSYCFVIFAVRYLTFIIVQKGDVSLFELTFQYLISIFSYPIARALLDRIYPLFNFKAKNA